jgi:ABC-2 type transport system ATP-binding protein
MHALEIKNLEKTYRNGVQALKGVSFNVNKGDFFGLLGPNGAGKSTTISILTSLVTKTAGTVKVFGHDIDKDFAAAKACIGVVPQEFNFNGFEKVRSIIVDHAGYYGIPRKIALERAEYYLKLLELWDKRFTVARFLSGGMKRRLMIARALVHQPRMLILDEPTAGVDIEIRRSMWKFLADLNKKGVTIILTTHYLEEAENLCRNIAIIDHGKIIEHSSTNVLLKKLARERLILYLRDICQQPPNIEGYKICTIDETTLEVEVPKELGITPLITQLEAQNIFIESMRNKANRLEELFLDLTKQN